MARLIALHAGGKPAPWESIGLRFDGLLCSLGDVQLRIEGDAPGLTGWVIEADRDGVVEIDGIVTHLVASASSPPVDRRIGDQTMTGLDHVVVTTDDLDRTCAAFTDALGWQVRRERDAGRGVRQRFFKLSNTIVEVVSGPHVVHAGASLWGMVVSIDDMAKWAEQLGPDVTSAPKPATQRGRFISTVRSQVGLGVPFAAMTPHIQVDADSE